MKKKYLYIIFASLSLTIGCKQRPILKITDLKFADFEKDKIATNNVETTFLISKNQTLNRFGSDTFGIITYDKQGRILINDRIEFMGTTILYEYDSIGLLKSKNHMTDFNAVYKCKYQFLPDSLILKQFWTGADSDTCLFKFDETGKLIEAIEYSNDDHGSGRCYQKLYEYNTSGLLIKKTENLIIDKAQQWNYEKKMGTSLSTKYVTTFYYTSERLDSTITKFYYSSEPNKNDLTKTYYDNNGLRRKSIDLDTIITTYIHKTRVN